MYLLKFEFMQFTFIPQKSSPWFPFHTYIRRNLCFALLIKKIFNLLFFSHTDQKSEKFFPSTNAVLKFWAQIRPVAPFLHIIHLLLFLQLATFSVILSLIKAYWLRHDTEDAESQMRIRKWNTPTENKWRKAIKIT